MKTSIETIQPTDKVAHWIVLINYQFLVSDI